MGVERNRIAPRIVRQLHQDGSRLEPPVEAVGAQVAGHLRVAGERRHDAPFLSNGELVGAQPEPHRGGEESLELGVAGDAQDAVAVSGAHVLQGDAVSLEQQRAADVVQPLAEALQLDVTAVDVQLTADVGLREGSTDLHEAVDEPLHVADVRQPEEQRRQRRGHHVEIGA